MKMFKPMTKEEALRLYQKLNEEVQDLQERGRDVTILKQAMENLYFFTDNFQHDY